MYIHKKIKLLSVNRCWAGRRFKTPEYKAYEKELLLTLPRKKLGNPPYSVIFEFGLHSRASDWDNPIKPLQDILCKKYGFDDKDVLNATIKKIKVAKKSDEYFKFEIITIEQG